MFDPYHKWLGIAKGQRPPNHYQLLGLSPGEDDGEVIEEAAIRQMSHLRTYQIGPHAADCTRLLNEISEARNTLLNPGKRQAYYDRLGAQTRPAPTRSAPAEVPDTAAATGKGVVIGLVAGGAGVAVLLGGLIVAFFLLRSPETGPTDTGKVAAGNTTNKPATISTNAETKKDKNKSPSDKVKPTVKETGDSRDKELKDKELKDKELKDKELKDKELKDKELKDKELKDKELKDKELKDKELKDKELKDKELKDKELKDKEKDDPKTVKTDVNGKVPPLKLGQQRDWSAGLVAGMVFLPDNRHVLTTGQSKVQLWNVETQKPVHVFSEAAKGNILGFVAVDRAGKRAAVVSSERSVADLWDLTTRKKVGSITHPPGDPINGLALSADGTRIFTCGGHIENNQPTQTWVRVWDFDKQVELFHLEGHTHEVQGVAVLPDGSRAVSVAGGDDVRLWDLEQKKSTAQITTGSKQPVMSFALSNDGRYLALGYYFDNAVRLIDLVARKEVAVYKGHTSHVTALAFSADGKYLASSGWGRTIFVLDGRDLTELNKIEGPAEAVKALAFSPDGKYLAAGGKDRQLRIWPILDGTEVVKTLDPPGLKLPLEVVSVRKWIAFGVGGLDLSGDGRLALTPGSSIRCWDVKQGKLLHQLRDSTKIVQGWAAIARDGKWGVTAVMFENEAEVWDLVKGKLRGKLVGHQERISAVALSTDNAWIYTGGGQDKRIKKGTKPLDPCVRVWDAKSLEEKDRIELPDSVASLAALPDGQLLAGLMDGTIRVLDLKKREIVATLQGHGKNAHVAHLAVTPDGERAASSGEDRTLWVWELKTGKAIHHLQDTWAYDLNYTANGTFLLASVRDKGLILFHGQSLQPVAVFKGLKDWIRHARITPDGRSVVGVSDRDVFVWPMPELPAVLPAEILQPAK